VGARAPWLSSVVSYKVCKIRGLRTAVAGDEPPLLGFSRLSERPHPSPGRVLVRDSLPAVPSGLEVFGDGHRPGPRSRQLPQTWMTLQGVTVRSWPAALAGCAGNLPGVPRPYSGHDLPESGSRGGSDLRHLPPPAFRTPSTVCSSNRLPALFRPVPLLGFSLQSFAPSRVAARLSAPVLSCRS
jgi:hypothetical protein